MIWRITAERGSYEAGSWRRGMKVLQNMQPSILFVPRLITSATSGAPDRKDDPEAVHESDLCRSVAEGISPKISR